jgi:excisionase family DNA binding protein
MQTIQFQLTLTLDPDAAKVLAELLGPALRQAVAQRPVDLDGKNDARLRAAQDAVFAGQKSLEDQGLLIDSKQLAKLLRISERTLWKLHHTGEMAPPIRIGRAVRWSLETLKAWIEKGRQPQGRI